MNTFKRLSLALALMLALAGILPAQTALSSTTLSQAVSSPNPSDSVVGLVGGTANSMNVTLYLASCTQTDMAAFNRVSAPVKLYIDAEAFDVQTINTTSCGVNVLRGVDGTSALPHASAAVVYIGTPDKFATFNIPPGTACTAGTGADLYSPRINISTGQVEDCLNGRWVLNSANLPGQADPQVTYEQPYTGFATFASSNAVAVNQATDIAGQFWFSQIFVPANAKITGACELNGSGTLADNVIYYLWDKSGAVVANTALAGTAETGASIYQCIAFTATVQVVGPQTYYIGVQGSATTAASFALYATGSAPKNYGTGTKSGTFGTAASITPNTTFTAAKGPIMTLY